MHDPCIVGHIGQDCWLKKVTLVEMGRPLTASQHAGTLLFGILDQIKRRLQRTFAYHRADCHAILKSVTCGQIFGKLCETGFKCRSYAFVDKKAGW